jgi:hypothetical protein
MRTLAMPTMHPIVQYVKPQVSGGIVLSKTMNDWVDQYIKTYFDDANVPYLNTIDLYVKYVVNKGVLKQDYKNKMVDVCHYIINVVIPNLPTQENPEPVIKWPPIEWLAKDWKPYNYSYNEDSMNNLFGGSTTYKRNSNIKSDAEESASKDSKGSDKNSPGSSSPGSDSSGSSSGQAPPGSSCNSGCPTDCFNQLIISLNSNTPGSKTTASNSPGSDSPGSTPGSKSPGVYTSANGQSHEDDKSDVSSFLTVNQVIVTNEKVNNLSSQELNNFVLGKLKGYFDIEFDLYPTKKIQADYADFVKIYGPIDRAHKNKLRDLVYYFMENIIPGLPTQEKPVCYVEWRPIRWLANSNL